MFGTFVKLTDPSVSEILAMAGFDFLLFDMEHAPVDLRSLENMIRACSLGGAIPTARVTANVPEIILRTMDLGLYGVQVPHVDTPEDAVKVVSSVRYRLPGGKRGLSLSHRAAGYGAVPADQYLTWVEEETLIVVQVESLQAFQNLETIVAVDGVDVVFFGPADLSQSAGVPGRTSAPEVQALLEKAPDIINRYPGKHAGIWVTSAKDAKRWASLGYRYVVMGTDSGFLRLTAKTCLEEAKG